MDKLSDKISKYSQEKKENINKSTVNIKAELVILKLSSVKM